ncbi:MAG: hypothetical protein ACKV2T_05615 [Kofleriaceae bacterium]
MTKWLGLISITIALVACKKTAPDAATKTVEAPVAMAPPAPAPPKAPIVTPSTPRGAILFAGTNPAQVDALRKGQGSLIISKGKIVAASCADDTKWAAEVVKRAQAAGDALNCQDRVCIHYHGDGDDDRVVFAFRADGSLAGVIDHVDTSDAGGTDDEVAELEEALVGSCPETDEEITGRFDATIERAKERGEL